MATGTTFGAPAHMAAFTDVDERWGPLEKLAGQWAGDQGRDFSYSYSEKKDTENLRNQYTKKLRGTHAIFHTKMYGINI